MHRRALEGTTRLLGRAQRHEIAACNSSHAERRPNVINALTKEDSTLLQHALEALAPDEGETCSSEDVPAFAAVAVADVKLGRRTKRDSSNATGVDGSSSSARLIDPLYTKNAPAKGMFPSGSVHPTRSSPLQRG